MYEQAQPVCAQRVVSGNGQTSGPLSQYRAVRYCSTSGRCHSNDNAAKGGFHESLESSSDTYEEPEAVRVQIVGTPVEEPTSGAKSLQEGTEATKTASHVDTSSDRLHLNAPSGGRSLCSFRCYAAAGISFTVVSVALVTMGLLLMVSFNKTSRLSTTVGALKRDLANERNKTSALSQRLLDQMGGKTTPVSCKESRKWSDTSVACPDGYTKFRGVCYQSRDIRTTFWDADLACFHDGGTLAMPRDADTNAFLVSLSQSVSNDTDFWLGLHDQREEGTFEWVDGSALCGYDSWAPGQPNSVLSIEDCVLVSATVTDLWPNKWYDAACHRRMFFFCQVVPGQM
ncbi:hypothetical protein Bbelb_107130 [Branchiostoma belcheri]|nr:hypothetical protein Bbelb_107130 [Branchiostoma belcheri]